MGECTDTPLYTRWRGLDPHPTVRRSRNAGWSAPGGRQAPPNKRFTGQQCRPQPAAQYRGDTSRLLAAHGVVHAADHRAIGRSRPCREAGAVWMPLNVRVRVPEPPPCAARTPYAPPPCSHRAWSTWWSASTWPSGCTTTTRRQVCCIGTNLPVRVPCAWWGACTTSVSAGSTMWPSRLTWSRVAPSLLTTRFAASGRRPRACRSAKKFCDGQLRLGL